MFVEGHLHCVIIVWHYILLGEVCTVLDAYAQCLKRIWTVNRDADKRVGRHFILSDEIRLLGVSIRVSSIDLHRPSPAHLDFRIHRKLYGSVPRLPFIRPAILIDELLTEVTQSVDAPVEV